MYDPHFRENKKGLPILEKKEINTIAEKIILDFDSTVLSDPHSVDIDQFAEFYLDLKLDYDYLSNCHCFLGMTVFNTSEEIIIYNPATNTAEYRKADRGTVIMERFLYNSKQFQRLRFTLAHECGHWIFHKHFYGYRPGQEYLFPQDNLFIQCRDVNRPDTPFKKGGKRSDYEWLEWQADKFAAAILMPETAIIKLMQSFYTAPEIEQSIWVDEISRVFDVSKQAALYRLYDLKIIQNPGQMDENNNQLSFF